MAELAQRMSYAEYVEWSIYYGIEPFGDHRADLQTAMIASASQSPHVKNGVDFEDFMLFKADRFSPPEDQEAAFDRFLERSAKASAASQP